MSRMTFLAFTGAALAIGTLASTSASAGFPHGHPAGAACIQTQVANNRFSNVHLPQVSLNRFSNVHAVPSQNNSSQPSVGGVATGVFNRAQSGGLSGLGVPGGLRTSGVGSDIIKGSGIRTSITPASTSDTAKGQTGDIKNQQGGAVGVQSKEGLSTREIANLQIAALKAKDSAGGAAAGVQQSAGVSPGQRSILQVGEQKAKDSATGAAAGVQAKDTGVKLSDAQLKAIRDLQVNPVVNPGTANDDDGKGAGKGGGKGGRITAADIRAAFKPIVADAKISAAKPSPLIDALGKLAVPKPPKPNCSDRPLIDKMILTFSMRSPASSRRARAGHRFHDVHQSTSSSTACKSALPERRERCRN